jgi:hypothetical protein
MQTPQTLFETVTMLTPICLLFIAVAVLVKRKWNAEDARMNQLYRRASSTWPCDACLGKSNVHPRAYGGAICEECERLMSEVNGRPVLRDERGVCLMYLD